MPRHRRPDQPHIVGPHPRANLDDLSTPPPPTRRSQRLSYRQRTPEQWNKPYPDKSPPVGPPWIWGCPSPTTPVQYGSETELERVRLGEPVPARKRYRDSESPTPVRRKARPGAGSSPAPSEDGQPLEILGDSDADLRRPGDQDSDSDISVIHLGQGSATPPPSRNPVGGDSAPPPIPPLARGGLFLPSESEGEDDDDDDDVQLFEVDEVEEEIVLIDVSDGESSDDGHGDRDLPSIPGYPPGAARSRRAGRSAQSRPSRRSGPSRRRRPAGAESGSTTSRRATTKGGAKKVGTRSHSRESVEDLVAEIALEEPERFYTHSRLRPRNSRSSDREHRRSLQRYINARDGIEFIDPEKVGAKDGDGNTDPEDGRRLSISQQMRNDVDGFFVEGADGDDSLLVIDAREELSAHNQDPEYHFKVVFHYMVSLVIRGTNFLYQLQLDEEESSYFEPALRFLRSHMKGLQNSIGGSIWHPTFRRKLETYPVWEQIDLPVEDERCVVCQRVTGQKSQHEGWLRGQPYDRATYQDIEDENDWEDTDDEHDEAGDGNRHKLGPMGPKCKDRAKRFHRLSHWEYNMFRFIEFSYREITHRVRRKGRGGKRHTSDPRAQAPVYRNKLSLAHICEKRGNRIEQLAQVRKLPKRKNLDHITSVVEWMDKHGFMRMMLKWLGVLEDSARKFEGEDHH